MYPLTLDTAGARLNRQRPTTPQPSEEDGTPTQLLYLSTKTALGLGGSSFGQCADTL
jgi:hypothetical protein